MIKRAIATAVVLAASFVAVAGPESREGVYWYPNANAVVFAGNPADVAQVCHYEANDTGTIVPVWYCEDFDQYGGKGPVLFVFDGRTPVKVRGARWAMALQYEKDRHHGPGRRALRTMVGGSSDLQERDGGVEIRGGHNYHDLGFTAKNMVRD
jgi:hypothetical protein